LDELSIKVNIADRLYPLSVTAEQEEQVRKAAKLVNDKLKTFEQQFSVKDKQDILSMCALELATELIRLQSNSLIEDKGLSNNLMEIKALLKNVAL
jgi:cell division protein ZapA (FtsZ GTPase activity inhibitor)